MLGARHLQRTNRAVTHMNTPQRNCLKGINVSPNRIVSRFIYAFQAKQCGMLPIGNRMTKKCLLRQRHLQTQSEVLCCCRIARA